MSDVHCMYFVIVGQSHQVSSAEQSTSTPALPTFHHQAPTHDVLNWCFMLDLSIEMKRH